MNALLPDEWYHHSAALSPWEKDLHDQGYCHHDWNDWQQGGCVSYAHALLRIKPDLRFGVMGYTTTDKYGTHDEDVHYYAHDDRYAYDSAGRHPLPYKGIRDQKDWTRTDQDPDDYDQPDEDEIADAMEHAKTHRILEGRYGPKTSSHTDGPGLPNPYHPDDDFHHTWFHGGAEHGSLDSRERYTDDDFAGPGKGHGGPQMNKLLGTHFSALRSVAKEFCKPYQDSVLYHARLKMQNPAYFPSEHELDRAVFRHVVADHPDFTNDEEFNSQMRWQGGGTPRTLAERDRQMADDHSHRTSLDQALGHIFVWHPRQREYAQSFVDHLKRQGHDGIVYGNMVEGPKYHHSAIAFDPDGISIQDAKHLPQWSKDGHRLIPTPEHLQDNALDESDERLGDIQAQHHGSRERYDYEHAAKRNLDHGPWKPYKETSIVVPFERTAALPSGVHFSYRPVDDFGTAAGSDFHQVQAKVGDETIGHITWHPATGEIWGIGVRRSHRRRGVATALLQEAHRVADERNLAHPEHSDRQTPDGEAWSGAIRTSAALGDMTDAQRQALSEHFAEHHPHLEADGPMADWLHRSEHMNAGEKTLGPRSGQTPLFGGLGHDHDPRIDPFKPVWQRQASLDEQLPLHPDLPTGMPEAGITKGNPQLPIFRGLSVEHGNPLFDEDIDEGLGKSPHHDRVIADHLMGHLTAPQNDRGIGTNVGIHWTHDGEWAKDYANHYHVEYNHGSETHRPVVVEAYHPGLEHVMSWDNPGDHKALTQTVGDRKYDQQMLGEVPVRPGAPLHIRALHVMDSTGDFHRIPLDVQHVAAVRNVSDTLSDGDGIVGGVMIAIVPPRDLAERLHIEDGEHPEQLHITLAYLGKTDEYSEEQIDNLPEVISAWVEAHEPFSATVQGVGTFVNSEEDGQHVLWAAVDSPGLEARHVDLVGYLRAQGYSPRGDHVFTPHMTLAYGKNHFRFMPKIERESWLVEEVWVCTAGRWESVKIPARMNARSAATLVPQGGPTDGDSQRRAAGRGDNRRRRDRGAQAPQQPGAAGPVGDGPPAPRPVTFHPRAEKDLSKLHKQDQRLIAGTIEALSRGDQNLQTHKLIGPLAGWYSTKASRGHRIIHRDSGDGGIYVGYVGLHEYGDAINRLS